MSDMMPKEQYKFIRDIEEYIEEETNYDDPYGFAFKVWQCRDFLEFYFNYFKENEPKPENEYRVALLRICDFMRDEGCAGIFDVHYKGSAEDVLWDLVDKATPKKVKYENRHGEGEDLWHRDYYNCPSCGCRLRNKKHFPYCPRCSQALDWSDENDG